MEYLNFWSYPNVPILEEGHNDALEFLLNSEEMDEFKLKARIENLNNTLLLNPTTNETENDDFIVSTKEERKAELITFANKFLQVLTNQGKAKELFGLASKQALETEDQRKSNDVKLSQLMDAQLEEMMIASSLENSNDIEIAKLVENHLNTRQDLENKIKFEIESLLQKQIFQFKSLVEQLAKSLPPPPASTSNSFKTLTRENQSTEKFNNVSQLKETVVTSDNNNQERINVARNIGRSLINPWIGRLPESLSLIGLTEPQSSIWGTGLPILANTSIHVNLGSNLRISFRLVALICPHPPDNVFVYPKYETWLNHSQALYTHEELNALALPSLGSVSDDFFMKACASSPEVHFSDLNSRLQKEKKNWTYHSNLLGIQMIFRGNDVQSVIRQTDEFGMVQRVLIPTYIWGAGISESLLLKKVKEALIDSAARRFVSGSKLQEIAFLAPSNLSTSEQKTTWISNMRKAMIQVFE